MTAALSARVEAMEALVLELVEAVLNPSPPIQCVSAMLIQAKDDFVALRATPPPPADPPDLERVREAFEQLLKHCEMEAMDKLLEENGRIVGWRKSDDFLRLTECSREALRLLGSAADAE